MINIVIIATIFLITVLLAMGISTGFQGIQSRQMNDRLRKFAQNSKEWLSEEPADDGAPHSPLLTLLEAIGGTRLSEKLALELIYAGIRISLGRFLQFSAMGVIAAVALAILIFRNAWIASLVGIAAICAPIFLVVAMQAKRRAAFEIQLIDMLPTMASSLRSGFSLIKALEMIVEEMPPPISQEFDRAINEINVGRSMESALNGIVDRMKSTNFAMVVAAISISHRVGGNLPDVLDSIAATVRERITLVREMRALTAEARLSSYVLLALPVVMLLIIQESNPTYVGILFEQATGRYMLAFALILEIIGYFIMRSMQNLSM
jgi:tight adherence protein B